MTEPPIISVRGVHKRYGATRALDAIDLDVHAGSVLALVGENGAGKSTLLRIVAGLARPDAGSIRLDGGDPLRHARSRAVLGCMIDGPAPYPHLTGRQNLTLVARGRRAEASSVSSSLEATGLDGAADRLAGSYSLGMRQRLGIAMALIGRPSVLLLDEPQNGLDPAAMRDMRALLAELNARGHTLVVSSHLLAELEHIATHVALIHRGTLRFSGSLDAFRSRIDPRLVVEVDRPEIAAQALAPVIGEPFGRDGARLTFDTGDTAAVARALVAAGVDIRHLALDRPTLERAFLDSTQVAPQP